MKIWEALRKKLNILRQSVKRWVCSKLKTWFLSPKNYDKRVGARIISQIIKTMNNSLFIEKSSPYQQLYNLHFYFCTYHQSIIVLCVYFWWRSKVRSCKRSKTLFKSLLFWLAGEVSWLDVELLSPCRK